MKTDTGEVEFQAPDPESCEAATLTDPRLKREEPLTREAYKMLLSLLS